MTETVTASSSCTSAPEPQIIINSEQFATRFLEAASSATKRLKFRCMSYLEDGEFPKSVTDAFVESSAAVRDFRFDESSFSCPDGHVSLTPPSLRRLTPQAINQRIFTKFKVRQMQDSGVNVRIQNSLNPVRDLAPYLGSDHRKVAIADDTAWVMSLNLNEGHIRHTGVAWETHDPKVVDTLDQLLFEPTKVQTYFDFQRTLSEDTRVLVDCGKPFSSLIMEDARRQILRGSAEVFFVSQFLPGGKMFEATLRAAKRGSRVIFVTSSDEVDKYKEIPYKWYFQGVLKEIARTRRMELVHLPGFSLVKMILTDGEVNLGSNNFSTLGHAFGTKEANIVTDNDLAVSEAHQFVWDLIATSR